MPRSAWRRELEHVALGHQPVAEADALDAERTAVRRDEDLAVDTRQRLRRRRRRQAEGEQEGEQEAHKCSVEGILLGCHRTAGLEARGPRDAIMDVDEICSNVAPSCS